MDALIHPTEEVIMPRDGHGPLSCRSWIPDVRGRKTLAWAGRKAWPDCHVACLGLNESWTWAVLSLGIMKRSCYRTS